MKWLFILAIFLTGCGNIIIEGDVFNMQVTDGLTATNIEMEEFKIIIPISGMRLRLPDHHEVMLQ